MDWGVWIAALALVWVATPFLLGPPLVRARSWLNRRPGIEPMARESLPGDVAPYLVGETERIQALGFVPVGFLRVSNLTPDVISHVALLVHRPAGDLAIAAVATSKLASTRYVEFCAEFPGGRQLNTNNGPEVGYLPFDPSRPTFAFPGLQDLSRLYRLHRRLIERKALPGDPRAPAEGREVEEFARDLASFASEVRSGYWRLDAAGDRYRPTWKGAVLMAWKLAWPVIAVRRALRRRRAAALLAQLEPPA